MDHQSLQALYTKIQILEELHFRCSKLHASSEEATRQQNQRRALEVEINIEKHRSQQIAELLREAEIKKDHYQQKQTEIAEAVYKERSYNREMEREIEEARIKLEQLKRNSMASRIIGREGKENRKQLLNILLPQADVTTLSEECRQASMKLGFLKKSIVKKSQQLAKLTDYQKKLGESISIMGQEAIRKRATRDIQMPQKGVKASETNSRDTSISEGLRSLDFSL